MQKKWLFIIAGIIILGGFLGWLFIESSKPLPGQTFAYNCDNLVDFGKLGISDSGDKCRAHIPEGTKVNYPQNPPVFGPHYSDWITKGFYDEPRADGSLIHSLEHGYVIISYDCEKKVADTGWNIVKTAYAQSSSMTSGGEGSPSASLKDMPKSFSDGSCNNLKNQIKDVMQKNGNHKLIAVPRVGMDSALILTAWNRMEKLNSVDQTKIKEFIDAFRDAGPESTVEP